MTLTLITSKTYWRPWLPPALVDSSIGVQMFQPPTQTTEVFTELGLGLVSWGKVSHEVVMINITILYLRLDGDHQSQQYHMFTSLSSVVAWLLRSLATRGSSMTAPLSLAISSSCHYLHNNQDHLHNDHDHLHNDHDRLNLTGGRLLIICCSFVQRKFS